MENALESASQNDPPDRRYSHCNHFEPVAVLSVDIPDNTQQQTPGNFHPEYLRQNFNKTGKKKYRKALTEPKNYPEHPKTWEMPAFETYRKKPVQTEDIHTEWEKCTIPPKPRQTIETKTERTASCKNTSTGYCTGTTS